MKLSVIMPVYNEINNFKAIFDKVLLAEPKDKEVVIVDDFSTDGTREMLQKLTPPENVHIFYLEKNCGKGAAIREALKHVSGEYIVIQDADMEYEPSEYIKLLQPLEEKKADIVYGSRFLGKFEAMSFAHKMGNKFLTLLTNLLYGVKITDMETCYKMFPLKAYQGIEIKSNRFDFEPEITSKFLKRGFKIIELPISYKARKFNEGKKISWKDGFDAVKALLRFKFFEK